MPIYEYCCIDCQQCFEEWQLDFEEREIPCPICGGDSKRLISNTAFVLKGSGWYVTDYSRGNGSGSKPAKAEPAKTESAKAETASSGTETSSAAPKSDSSSQAT